MNLRRTKKCEEQTDANSGSLDEIVDKVKEKTIRTAIKESIVREQIEIVKSEVLHEIESEKQFKNEMINKTHQKSLKEIADKDKVLEEALLTGDKEKICEILSSMIPK